MTRSMGVGLALMLATVAFLYMRDQSESEPSSESKKNSNVPKSSSASNEQKVIPSSRRRPVLDEAQNGSVTERRQPTRVYIREDGTEVRDHRKNPPAPRTKGDTAPPPPNVLPRTVMAVRRGIGPAVKDCIASFAGEAPEGTKATAELSVSIVSEQLKIDALDMSVDGGWNNEARFRECMAESVLGHTQVVRGAQDVASHSITFPYAL